MKEEQEQEEGRKEEQEKDQHCWSSRSRRGEGRRSRRSSRSRRREGRRTCIVQQAMSNFSTAEKHSAGLK